MEWSLTFGVASIDCCACAEQCLAIRNSRWSKNSSGSSTTCSSGVPVPHASSGSAPSESSRRTRARSPAKTAYPKDPSVMSSSVPDGGASVGAAPEARDTDLDWVRRTG